MYVCVYYTRCSSKTYLVYCFSRHLCSIDWERLMLQCIYIYVLH